MLIEIILIILGIATGICTGLIPGLHINLVATLLTTLHFSLISPLGTALYIVSLAITHTILDFIPSVYLGAAEESTFLSVLPGHELLKQGKAHEAVMTATIGAVIGTFVALITTFPIMQIAVFLEEATKEYIPWILTFVCCYVIVREEKPLKAATFFFLAGCLGFVTTNLPIREPLLPLLGGLFGASGLIVSIKNKAIIPKQEVVSLNNIILSKKETVKATTSGLVAAIPFSFLPALGSGYGSFIASEITSQSQKGFLFLNGFMNAMLMVLSIPIVLAIGKARTGAAAAINQLLGPTLKEELILLLIVAVISALISFFLAYSLAKKIAQILPKINYEKVSIFVISLVTLCVLIISKPLGLLVFITATALGITVILSGVKRTNLMGSLLIPTILFYLT